MKFRDFVNFFAFLFGMMIVLALAEIVFAYESALTYTEMVSISAMSTILLAIREKK